MTAPRYRVETATAWSTAVAAGETPATPFQDPIWLASWYEALRDRPGVTPLVVTAYEAATGAMALRLPLVVRQAGRARTIEFADLGLTDYNAPILGPAAPRDAAGAGGLWRAIRRALPAADRVSLRKMPPTLLGRPNPLALLSSARPCPLNGNVVETGPDWDGYRRGLVKTVRKELERSWRVFEREPGTRFELVTDVVEALRIVDALAEQQGQRMRAVGADYVLDDPAFDAFYRRLVAGGLDSGYVVVSALRAGEAVVASLIGIRDADAYVMIRIANAGEGWSHCSPGRLIIERTMAALHAQGCRSFDFSIGDYDYKRRFGVVPLPLVDLGAPLGLRGLPAALRADVAGRLREHPALDAKVRALARRLGSRANRTPTVAGA